MKKMTEETKSKFLYSGELFIFFIVFEVIAILEYFQIINVLKKHPNWLYYITSLGVVIGIVSIVSYLVSKKKREQKSLLDLLLLIPSICLLAVFDIYYFSNKTELFERRYLLSILFGYNGLSFLIQAIYHWFKPIPGLIEDKTERLIIRRFRPTDLEDYKEYISRKEVVEFEPYEPMDLETAKADLEKKMYSTDFYAIELKDSHKMIGQVYLAQDGDICSLGYVFSNDYWGKGYASEACEFLLKQAKKNKVSLIKADCKKENIRSFKLLEKLGFQKIEEKEGNLYYELKLSENKE